MAARPNRRVLPRFPVDEEATLLLVNHGARIPCRIVDISQGGCRLLSRERFQAGIMVRVEVHFKVRGLAFRFSGVTQWTDSRHQVGIRFIDVIPRRRDELIEALEELAAELAIREAERAAMEPEEDPSLSVRPDDPLELILDSEAEADAQTVQASEEVSPDADEPDVPLETPASSARPSYLESLFARPFSAPVTPSEATPEEEPASTPAPVEKPEADRLQPTPEAGPEARPDRPAVPERPVFEARKLGPLGPAQPVTATVPAPAAPSKRERRSQERHTVDTTAVLYLVKIASRLSGRILDLSMSGCRIRTDERFPVGIYTRIEIEFHLEGLPFRLGGVVQAIHDRHHIGIRYLDISDRKREQLAQLIEEIKEAYGDDSQEQQWSDQSGQTSEGQD
jgi:hypothetical protein